MTKSYRPVLRLSAGSYYLAFGLHLERQIHSSQHSLSSTRTLINTHSPQHSLSSTRTLVLPLQSMNFGPPNPLCGLRHGSCGMLTCAPSVVVSMLLSAFDMANADGPGSSWEFNLVPPPSSNKQELDWNIVDGFVFFSTVPVTITFCIEPVSCFDIYINSNSGAGIAFPLASSSNALLVLLNSPSSMHRNPASIRQFHLLDRQRCCSGCRCPPQAARAWP